MIKNEGTLNRAEAYPAFDLIVMGASYGGIKAFSHILSQLPADFPAAIAIVQHLAPNFSSHLPAILGSQVALPITFATEGARIQPSTVYVAPPNRHLLVKPNRTLALSDAAKVQYARPSVDVLFDSAATSYGERTLGVILTGRLTDGKGGAQAIKSSGGWVLVQDPATAEAYGMPRATIATGAVDFVLPLDTIAHALVTLVMIPGTTSFFRVPQTSAAVLARQRTSGIAHISNTPRWSQRSRESQRRFPP